MDHVSELNLIGLDWIVLTFTSMVTWPYTSQYSIFSIGALLERHKFEDRKFNRFGEPENFQGHVTITMPRFETFFQGVMLKLSPGACMQNFNSIALDILELLALNCQKFRVSRE